MECQLHCRRCYSAADTGNQHGLSGGKPSAPEKAPSCCRADWIRGHLSPSSILRLELKLVSSHHTELSVTTPAVLTQESHLRVEYRVKTSLERRFGDERSIDNHLVANGEASDTLTKGLDHTRYIVSRDMGKGRRFG
ncbi:unannotated protein [freshwater metagenome]|uniref:Unannotated protein n=1 Tax=freshwater metagenome TaxID=449393 RepID=A0A6J6CK37_9ZZZZ